MGMRTWIAGAILGLSCVAHADDVLTRVEAWLSAGFEPAGIHDPILALGEEGEAALWTLYGDARKSRIVRLRALNELSLFATPRTAQGFARVIREAPRSRDPLARSPLVLRRALDGLRAIAEQQATSLTSSDLTPVLHHTDAHVRKAAVTLLSRIDPNDVDGQLAALADRDPSRMVRATAQHARAVRLRP